MNQVTEVIALQTLDDEAATYRAALSDIERRLRGSDELDEARREFASAESDLRALQKEQRRVEAQIEGLTARIEPEEKRLYDGSVKNPKELASIQHELELLKERRSHFEDELLDLLSRVDIADREHRRTVNEVSRLETAWEREQQDLKHEARRLGDSIARADKKRTTQAALVTPRSLRVYEEVRRKRGGMAVARIQGGTCSGCRIQLPDALRRRTFSADLLAQCPNCERILYIG